ncbi:MAG: hypothetical protein GWP91_12505 [Rhodobacterales bacterium]|nr:hypothetical protein [Rhodobacterales bacterium]
MHSIPNPPPRGYAGHPGCSVTGAWILWLGMVPEAHIPVVYFVGPEDDWCTEIALALTGDVFKFEEGDYYGPCVIDGLAPDEYGEQLYLETLDPQNPAVFHNGGADFILHITGETVNTSQLVLGDVPEQTVGIRVTGSGHRIRALKGTSIAGTAIQFSGDTIRIDLVDIDLVTTADVAIELGCDGCVTDDPILRNNLIVGPAVGVRAVEVTGGAVYQNVISATETAIDWASRDVAINFEGNLLLGDDAAFVLQSGPADLYSNIVVGSPALWSVVGDQAQRIIGNTFYSNGDAVLLEAWSNPQSVFQNNAHTGLVSGTQDFSGNVACRSAGDCWVDAGALDFYAAIDSPLRTDGVKPSVTDERMDWCLRDRAEVPTVGALEAISQVGFGPIPVSHQEFVDCRVPSDPVDSTPTSPTSGTPPEDTGCGCSTTPTHPGLLWLGLMALVRRRRATSRS